MYRFLSMAYLKVLKISLKFYSKIQSREIAKPSQLETFLSPTSQSKWPSRMNHPVDGIDPEGFHSACAYTCVLTAARFAGLACLRLSSANEFRFSATVGCHVKLYRRFFLSQPLPYVHMSPLRRVRGDAWSVSEKDYFFPSAFIHVFSQLSWEIVSFVCIYACESREKRVIWHVRDANPVADRCRRSKCVDPCAKRAKGHPLLRTRKDHGDTEWIWRPSVNI